jgi:hypothetical protein
MAKLFGMFGINNKERDIVYKNGKYFYTNPLEEIPAKVQQGLETTVFKQRGSVSSGPYDMTALENLKKQVQVDLRAGKLQKENQSHSLCA